MYLEKKILPWFKKFINYKGTRVSKNTIPNYWAVEKNLIQFLELYPNYKNLSDIRIPFMRAFNDMLYNKFKAHHIKRNLNTLQAFVKWCVNMELTDFSRINEYIIETPYQNYKPVSLTNKELKRIEKTALTGPLENVKKLFLIQCYTGLAYGDLNRLQQGNINIIKHKGAFYLIGLRKKTKVEFNVPLEKKGRKLLKKFISKKIYLISNQKYNQYLKEVAGACAIEKHLTTHVGRRTCGQLQLNKGFSIEAVSRMLGHTDIKTTQKHYAKASFERVHNENIKIVA